MSDEKLKWVRAFSPDIIPEYLVEQVHDRQYQVEDFYKYQRVNCLVNGKEGQILNPFNHLYVLTDDKHIVKGFLWFVLDPLTKNVLINTYSIDKEYWNSGKAVKYLADHMKKILKILELKTIYWVTRYPKHSERYGFKKARGTLMEYREEEDGGHIDRIDKHRSDEPIDTTATTDLQPSDTTTRPSVHTRSVEHSESAVC